MYLYRLTTFFLTLWVPHVQVFMRLVEVAYPSLLCSTHLALSSLSFQPRPLHWCMIQNDMTFIQPPENFSQLSFSLNFNRPWFFFTGLDVSPQNCYWNSWTFSDSLSSRVALSFYWTPSYAGLPGNELAHLLAITGATLPFTELPSPLASVIFKLRHSHYSTRRQTLLSISLSPDFLGLPFPTRPL